MGFLIKRDDFVVVIKGKDAGKKGRVIRVFPEEKRVLVEGVNFVKK
ncbi:MAG: KOW motif-containing protein, partial [Candidatus Omnitrophica bacterium]|nr:KOW motif-containing protein [Candidatus Omnitrophota bacterium]